MKIAFIGDIYGNLPAFTKVLQHISEENVNDIYCTGDIVGYGPYPNEVIDLLKETGIHTIMGNHDDAVGYNLPVCGCIYSTEIAKKIGEQSLSWTKKHVSKDNRKFLRALPEELRISLPNGEKALVFNGSPRAINEYIHKDTDEEILHELIIEQDAKIFVFGHTHKPFVRSFKDRIFVNVGSVGQPKDGDNRACYVLIDFYSTGISVDIKRVEYNFLEVITYINDVGLPEELGEILSKGKAL